MKANELSNGSTWAWRKLRARVIREEPTCRLRLPGCTHVSTTADHIIPRSVNPRLTMVRSNLRGACASCNYKRGSSYYTDDQRQPSALSYFTKPVEPQRNSNANNDAAQQDSGAVFSDAESADTKLSADLSTTSPHPQNRCAAQGLDGDIPLAHNDFRDEQEVYSLGC